MRLVCPDCETALLMQPESARCEDCAETYYVAHGVPILIKGTRAKRKAALPVEGFAEEIAATGPTPINAEANCRLREAFSLSFEFNNPVIQSESSQFINRLRTSNISVRDPYPQPASLNVTTPSANDLEKAEVEIRIVTFPSCFEPGDTCSFNVQIKNVGQTTLSSKSARPFCISYKIRSWLGRTIEGARTSLLIDLPPGRAITQPIRVVAPKWRGRYFISIQSLIEGIQWLGEPQSCRMIVGRNKPTQWKMTESLRSYGEDHQYAARLLSQWLGDWQGPILEIGGNYRPSSPMAGRPVVNVDVDPFALMASAILYGDREDVKHVVGDGMNLPIGDGSAHAIVMFATFHHFPDPVGLLSHIKRKLAPAGRLFLMCEPIGHVFAETDYPGYFHELEQGAYEQSFMPWEYEQLLASAGFNVVDAVLDIGSAKIAATPSEIGS